MRATRTLPFGIGCLLALWTGWGVYVSRTTERVPSETLDRFDGVEIRRYPETVLVETTAPDRRTAFGRLFRYISGANTRREDVAMTAPVAIDERVDRERTRLLESLSRREIETRGDPTLLQYNDPWTPPFLRTNEVEIEVALEDVPARIRRDSP